MSKKSRMFPLPTLSQTVLVGGTQVPLAHFGMMSVDIEEDISHLSITEYLSR